MCFKLSNENYLLLLVFLCVLANLLWWRNAHLCRLEGLQTIPHGPLEDLLHFVFILVDIEMAPAVPVSVLKYTKHKSVESVRPTADIKFPLLMQSL